MPLIALSWREFFASSTICAVFRLSCWPALDIFIVFVTSFNSSIRSPSSTTHLLFDYFHSTQKKVLYYRCWNPCAAWMTMMTTMKKYELHAVCGERRATTSGTWKQTEASNGWLGEEKVANMNMVMLFHSIFFYFDLFQGPIDENCLLNGSTADDATS